MTTTFGAPDERGVLTIEARAVERIAAAVAGELDQVGGVPRRVLAIAVGSADPEHRPHVDAVVDGGTTRLDVRCSVAYPAAVAAVTDRLRAHLHDRVAALTGLTVRAVDVTVVALSSASTTTERSGRRNLA